MWPVIIASILFIIGGWGVILPVLPGVPVAWLGLLIYAYSTHFATISLPTVLILLGLTILTVILDFLLPIWGLKKFQPSKEGIWGAAIGLLLGIVFSGPLGLVIGPILGSLIGELYAGKDLKVAAKTSSGTVVGLLLSAVLKLILIAVMAAFFLAALF